MSLNYFNPFFTVKVMDGLFISNQTASKDQQFIMNNKFSLIINTCPLQFKILPFLNVYKVTNFHWQNSRGQMIENIDMKLFLPIFQDMTKQSNQGHGILIVSDRGHSRAITFVLLYLMYKFSWDLFKALQYINSKRQNLQVRSAYLKLLVSYDKILKPQSNTVQNNQTSDLSTHIKQSLITKKQKWSSFVIKSTQQQLVTNTFKNTFKKHNINELNQQYREMINKVSKQQKRPQTTIKGLSKEEAKTKKKIKNVQFSNEIEIIIKQSPVTHIFPQYEELSPEFSIMDGQKQPKVPNQSNNKALLQQSLHNDHSQSIHSLNTRQSQIRVSSQIKQINEGSPIRFQHKKQGSVVSNISSSNNSKLINIRRMQNMSNKLVNNNDNRVNIQQMNNNNGQQQNEIMIMSSSQDMYKNEFDECEIQRQQSNKNKYVKQIKQSYLTKQPIFRSNYKIKQEYLVQKNQSSSQSKTQQLLSHQVRPSSLKKFQAVFIQDKPKNILSPKKKQKKTYRILTQPKYDYDFQNPLIQDEQNQQDKSRRRLSASQNQDQDGFFHQHKIYQHKKSASTTMALKMMNRFQKKSSTPFRQQRRCPTPQIINSQTIKQLKSSSQNNFFTHPLSQKGANSLKMTNKKSITSSIDEKQLQKHSGQIFNVNINVNIGKLQMFGIKNNGRESRQSIAKDTASKQKIFKTHSQIDKSHLLYNRIRSNSSNDNYSKFSVSSLSINEKSNGQKFESHLLVRNNKQRPLSRKMEKMAQRRQINGQLIQKYAHNDPYMNEDDNIFAGQAISKKEIVQKINRKLIKNSRNSKRGQHIKKGSIIQNNFI